MAKYNAKKAVRRINTVNMEGAPAYKESAKLELVSILLTSFVQDQFYRSENETVSTVKDLISKTDRLFAAKAAIYARNEYGMRSISHLVAGEIAGTVRGQSWTKNFYNKVIHRPDDMTEIMSYYLQNYGKPIPNSLKKGLAQAFNKFDEYQLAKYRCENSAVSLVDLVNMVHPKPTVKNGMALQKLIKGKLKGKDTWETELTKAGQKATTQDEKDELKKDVWVDLIREKKIGYFALLRNLRNIMEQSPDILDEAIALLQNEELIKKSLVLPFRFSTAYETIRDSGLTGASKVLRAISRAVDISLSNTPKFDGKTVVMLDVSGSMAGRPIEVGALFMACLAKANDADVILFENDAHYKTFNLDDSTLTIAKNITDNFDGGGTNLNAAFSVMNKKYDRIIILSDMQNWLEYRTPTRELATYKKTYNADPYIFSFDLQGYGTLQFPERNVYCLAGFSDKTMDVMKFLESDKQALIHKIESIEL